MKILKGNQIFVNKKKCDFGRSQPEYLGHIVSTAGVSADPAKVENIINWPQPKNSQRVARISWVDWPSLPICRNYGSITEPLTHLLKKEAFKRSCEDQKAFVLGLGHLSVIYW